VRSELPSVEANWPLFPSLAFFICIIFLPLKGLGYSIRGKILPFCSRRGV
jgi:hypothetical protein